MPGFVDIARDAFAFLEREFGFSIEGQFNREGGDQITYVNVKNGVAVKPTYEFSSAFVFVFIYKLEDGKIRENHLPITDKSTILCFDFNDALAPSDKMKPAYMYDERSNYFDEKEGLRNYVNDFATRLKKYGKKLLAGDFEILPEMERIIKRRAHELS